VDTKEIIKSQYLAALGMLCKAVKSCPPQLWDDDKAKNRFWQVSYHALFYTHLYLQESEEKFVPWRKHREHYQFLGVLPWPPHKKPEVGEPYSQEEILEFSQLCLKEIEPMIASVDFAADSGFPWLPFNKMELQLYNIRHIQHHAGVLIDRLRNGQDIGIRWISRGSNV
jgi:hypothetical protein